MDRAIVYTGQVPLERDFLLPQRNVMVGIAKLSEAVLGSQTTVDGLQVTPTSPASMAVRVSAGQIYQQAALDPLAYGLLPADTAHQIVKQGLLLDPQTIQITAPGTPGYSQWFLLQAAFQERDEGAQVLPYYNSANPAEAYAGPGNSGEAQYTQRNGRIVIQIKAGAPAPTGTHPVPQADPGWVSLAWVGAANGQTSIQSQHIVASAAPRRPNIKLPDLAASVGYRVIHVTASRNLTVDDMGMVLVDLAAFSGPITLNLPPANALGNGTPLRLNVVGRPTAPYQNFNYANMPYAVIQPAAGNALDFSWPNTGIYCGPNDSIELMSDGASRWFWINQKHALHTIMHLTAPQVIPNGVLTTVSFTSAGQQYPFWSASTPTTWGTPTWMRVRVSANVSFAPNSTGNRHARVVVNGAHGSGLPMTTHVATGSAGMGNMQLSLAGGHISVRPGEGLQLQVAQDSGAPLAIQAGETWMNVEVVN